MIDVVALLRIRLLTHDRAEAGVETIGAIASHQDGLFTCLDVTRISPAARPLKT